MQQVIIVQPQSTALDHPTPAIDTDWLNYFSPIAALESVVGHVAALPSNATPEKHTSRVYASGLRYFFAWATNSPVDTDLRDLVQRPMPLPTEAMLVAFKGHMRATGRAASTISSKYFVPVRHWLRALGKQHIPGLTGDVRDMVEDYRHAIISALDVKPPTPQHASTRSALYRHGTRLRVDQINDLFAYCSEDRSLAGLRDLALLYMGITSALRISEIQRLTLANIAPGETSPYEITVRGKRGQQDPVAVDATTVRLIKNWVNAFNAALPDDTLSGQRDPRHIDEQSIIWQPLRCGRPESLHRQYNPATGLSRGALRDIIMRRAQASLGIELNPHDLRRTYAARATEADIPLAIISRQLRHQNLATTAKYIGEPPNLGAALLSNRIQFQVPA